MTGTVVGGDFSGQQFADWKQKGGWFRSDKYGTDYSAMNSDLANIFDQSAMAVYKQVENYATVLKLPTESLKNVSSSMRIVLGDDQKKNEEAINKAFGDYQSKLAEQFRGVLTPFVRAGETLVDTMARLAALESFSASLNEFGGIFSTIAGLSIDAREQLIGFAGGIEAFIAKTQNFVDQYYTQSEKAGLQAGQLLDAFKAIGIDASTLGSREDFRALVESQNVNTEEGRKTFAALLDLGPIFAGVADYLKENNQTLADAAAAAPQVEALKGIFEQQQAAADAQNQMLTGQEQTNEWLGDIFEAISSGNGQIGGFMKLAVSAIDKMNSMFSEYNSRPIASEP